MAATPTPTGTLTPTPTPGGGTQFLNFNLRFGGITSRPNDSSNRQIKIYATALDDVDLKLGSPSDKKTVIVAPDDNGVYRGSIDLASNYFGHHYRLRVKGPLHVQVVFPDKVFSADTVLDLTANPLPPGDLNGKGYADSTDLDKVWSRLHSTAAADLAVADLNYSSEVTIDDYALILKTLSTSNDAE